MQEGPGPGLCVLALLAQQVGCLSTDGRQMDPRAPVTQTPRGRLGSFLTLETQSAELWLMSNNGPVSGYATLTTDLKLPAYR